MAITNPNRTIKVQQLNYFKTKLDALFQTQAVSITGITATTVVGAIAELLTKFNNNDVTFEQLTTPNTGKLATYRFTKGETTMDIDIEKDHMRAIVGFVTITESGGKYYDGTTEVTSADGVTGAGVYLKSKEVDTSGAETGVVKYADASAVIEYLTVGDQTGKVVTLNIANNQITADIADGAIAKAKLSAGVQASLDKADSALQEHQDISGKADKDADAVEGNFAAFDENGNPVDSGKKASDFQAAGNYKTQQTAVSDPTASGDAVAFIDSISQNANGEITVTKKNVLAASASAAGLMSAAHYSKVEAIVYAENSDIDEIFA